MEVLEKHKSKFGENFDDNKKSLDSISIIRSKGLKNEIAGYITKFIKKENREQKAKQEQIEIAESELAEEQNDTKVTETIEEPVEKSETTTENSESAEIVEPIPVETTDSQENSE